jgi:natural product biosynthesis luciferase-like monooxygenase protein
LAHNTWVLIGNGSLLAGCGDVLLRHGQKIAAVVTSEAANERWASDNGIRVEPSASDLTAFLSGLEFDHLASIAHLSIIPAEALRLVRGLAVNFHDGPLPELAGLNVTSWAILRGEKAHGVTWHAMTERADAGRILEQRRFDVAPDETAFLLNAKCYATGLESFADLARRVGAGDLSGREQDLTGRTYFGRWARPAAGAVIVWQSPAEAISALVRALDFGSHPNPLGLPKLFLGDRFVAVGQAAVSGRTSGLASGTIVAAAQDQLQVATETSDVVLSGLVELDGTPLAFADLVRRYELNAGKMLPSLDPALTDRLSEQQSRAARSEDAWREVLASLSFSDLDVPEPSASSSVDGRAIEQSVLDRLPRDHRIDSLIAAIAVLAARRSGASTLDLAYSDGELASRVDGSHGFFTAHVPLRVTIDRSAPFAAAVAAVSSAREALGRRGPLAVELWARDPELRAALPGRMRDATISIGVGVEPPPARVRFAVALDGSQCTVISSADELAHQLAAVIGNALSRPDRPVSHIDLMTEDERETALRTWNDTRRPVPASCVHELFVDQARRTPDATALVFRGRRMTYRELDERTNRLARHLQSLAVGRDVLVGIYLQRSFAMVEAVLATLKAGGAYVPLDPTYPADRIAFMVEDAGLGIVLTEENLRSQVPSGPSHIIALDTDQSAIAQQSADPIDGQAAPSDLAYVIYTSGSTGRPKGVMIEHHNVANFVVGMDERIDTSGDNKTWLAVTSLSFDISVLELLWTLGRGFTVVLHRDEDRESFLAVAAPPRPIDFSLFYFSSNANEHEQDKYRLLMDGARFADQNDFVAVWTPERHFHAFGGLFPNPAVTSAAIAATTKKIGIRAGSVVSPLHSTLRIAEEWSIVDNLSNGRVAISFAPGWQPNDFVLKPDAFGKRKDVMFEQIEHVRKLWRGEALPFVNGTGQTVDVHILPRPVQKELPVWVTIAGNPESFVAAARAGANVLTHLLGQTVKEVGEKVELYRRTWRECGHSGRGTVTMMVHTFVGDSDAAVKDLVREPMKEYLRSAVGLVREAAWSFPTFKQKATNEKGEFDPDNLSAEEMDALLEHAFDRYYSASGLFGSAETGRRFVDALRDIGIDEVACLIDFGVATDSVLASLPHLAGVARMFKAEPRQQLPAQSDAETIPSLIEANAVTHFQCTPTMAHIQLQDGAARPAFKRLRQMLVGGEALPLQLARDLAATVGGVVTNVYGPTETTVWSSTSRVEPGASEVTIGFPLANTTLHVLDRDGRLAPAGLAGELHIGGQGVVRGYWKRPELTAERFVDDPFGDGKLYRTGDLVRRRQDGALEFLGRLDHQVKIRGHRIELGEIESRLSEHADVQETVVIARDDGAGPELVAYVIVRGSTLDEAELRAHLRTRVPEYMMPRAFVRLTAFPMTPNRKVDRKKLPAPQRAAVVIPMSARPQSSLEQAIAAIWCEVLEVPEVGTSTNFADVGGHSLAMVQVLGRLKDRVNPKVTLVDLFRYTTIGSLAKFLTAAGDAGGALEASAQRAASRRAAVAQRGRARSR